MSTLNTEFKRRFHELLKQRVRDRKKWVPEIAGLLNCTATTIYKKSGTDHFYTVDEMLLLIRYYSIDVNQLFENDGGQKLFHVPGLMSPVQSVNEYLRRLDDTLCEIETMEDARIHYATRELPVFYFFTEPELALFKLFVFARTVWKLNEFEGLKLDEVRPDEEFGRLLNSVWLKYSSRATVEYWNAEVMDSTLDQLVHFYEAGEITLGHTLTLLNALESLIVKLRGMSIAGSKREGASPNLRLYENKMIHTSNHIMIRSSVRNKIYITFDNPNYIVTQDDEFVKYAERWYEAIAENSYLLGRENGHFTNLYFKHLQHKADLTRERIKAFRR